MFLPLNKQCIYHKCKENNKKARLIVSRDVITLAQSELSINYYKVKCGRYKHTYRKKKNHVRQSYTQKLKNLSEGKRRRYYRRIKKLLAEHVKGKLLAPDPGTSVDCYEINMSEDNESYDLTKESACLTHMAPNTVTKKAVAVWKESSPCKNGWPIRSSDAMSRTHLLGVGPAYSMHAGGDGPTTPQRRTEETAEEGVDINSLIVADETLEELSELPDLDDEYLMAVQG